LDPFDTLVGQLVERIEGPPAVIVDAATYFGDRLLIWPITLATILLVSRKCRSIAVLLAVAAVSALVVEVVVKFLIGRPRHDRTPGCDCVLYHRTELAPI
jgi:hypothetical protein